MARLAALAALGGALAITYGTSGAHLVEGAEAQRWLLLAATFQLAHAAAALAVLALAPGRAGRLAAALLTAGAYVFGATLAGLAFGGPRWLGALAPAGGTLMLIGWIVLAARFATARPRR